jgi:hypothetical protein
MANEKIYFKGFGKIKKSNYGIKIQGSAEKLIAAINECKNEKGYVNLELKERREADQYGNTHYIEVDTWQPSASANTQEQPTSNSSDSLPF